jgi:hypothetical protein
VAKAVDRLELVAHEEELGVRSPQQIHELALQTIRVLELVDHDRAETQLLALADPVVTAEQVARCELEVFEVDSRLGPLRGRVPLRESVQ